MGREEVLELIKQIGLDEVSLHDCCVSNFVFSKNELTLEFDDGVWLSEKHKQNVYDGTHKTSKARVSFTFLFDDYDMVVMRKDRSVKLFRKEIIRTVKEYRMKDIEMVVNSQSLFEIVSVYHGFQKILIEGYMDHTNYATLHIDEVKDITLSYEKVREDRVW